MALHLKINFIMCSYSIKKIMLLSQSTIPLLISYTIVRGLFMEATVTSEHFSRTPHCERDGYFFAEWNGRKPEENPWKTNSFPSLFLRKPLDSSGEIIKPFDVSLVFLVASDQSIKKKKSISCLI